ncbi:MAG: hypothetical protein ABIE74_02690 [Pseudomonadota bacterium]
MKIKITPFVLFLSLLFSICFAQSSLAAATITSINPTTGDQGQTLNVRILGTETNFVNGTSVATFSGTGITLNSTTVTDATHAVANITIAADATLSARDVNVITGAETPTPLTGGFTVEQPTPTVTAVTPSTGIRDAIVNITNLAGTNFRAGATAKITKAGEDDINCTSLTVVSATKITCTLFLLVADPGFWDVVVTNDDGQSAMLQDGFEVTKTITNPQITLKKSGPTEGAVGDTAQYSFWVSNTGDEALTGVVLSDPMVLAGNGTISLGNMPVDFSITHYEYYTIKSTDANPLVNTATVSGRGLSSGTAVSDQNSHTMTIGTEIIDIQKTGPAAAKSGETITYTFVVTNNSSEALNNVEITDPLFGQQYSQTVGDLAANGSQTFTTTYTITDAAVFPLENTATTSGFDSHGLEVTDTDTHTITDSASSGKCSLNINSTRSNMWVTLLILFSFIVILGFIRERKATER